MNDIPNTSYIALNSGNGTYTLRFLACWEKTDTTFSSPEGFDSYIQQVADRLANPIKTTVIHQKQPK